MEFFICATVDRSRLIYKCYRLNESWERPKCTARNTLEWYGGRSRTNVFTEGEPATLSVTRVAQPDKLEWNDDWPGERVEREYQAYEQCTEQQVRLEKWIENAGNHTVHHPLGEPLPIRDTGVQDPINTNNSVHRHHKPGQHRPLLMRFPSG